jgi:hypothetical protein
MSLIRKISKGRSARYKNKNKKEAEEARVEECKKAPEDDGGNCFLHCRRSNCD